MASTSGTVSQTSFETRQVIDHAFRRCKLSPQKITSEHLETARDVLYLLLSAMANDGVPLWCQERQIVGLYENQGRYPLDVGTVDVLQLTLRGLTRLTDADDDVEASSAGGTVANAFDGDVDTILTQVSTNGNVQANFTDDVRVTSVGYMAGSTTTMTLVVESSSDGSTWATRGSYGAKAMTDGVWYWLDLDGAPAAQYWRMRETGGGTIAVREMYFGSNPSEVPIARLNSDDWWSLPDKTILGQPLQFWFDRQVLQPVINVWQVPNSTYKFYQMVMLRHRQIMDVGALTEIVEVPQRWYDAVVWDLAHRLCFEVEEVDDSRIPIVEVMRDKAVMKAWGEERDQSSSYLAPDISVYTT